MKKRILCLFVLLISLSMTPGKVMAQPARLTFLKDVGVVTSADSTRIELRFNGVPNQRGIIYQEAFLQIDFSDSYINPPKQWFQVEDDIVKNIFVYQFDDSTVRIRFFTSGNAKDLKDKITFLKENNKVIIKYDVAQGVEMIHPITPSTPLSTEESVKPVITPSVTLPQNIPPEKVKEPIATGFPDIYASFLKMALALGIVLSLLFTGIFLVKKLLGKRLGMAGQNQGIRIITSVYIGPKKSIALLDISGERIVVGITPSHITMLTRLSKEGEFGEILKEEISSKDKVELDDELWEKV